MTSIIIIALLLHYAALTFATYRKAAGTDTWTIDGNLQ